MCMFCMFWHRVKVFLARLLLLDAAIAISNVSKLPCNAVSILNKYHEKIVTAMNMKHPFLENDIFIF